VYSREFDRKTTAPEFETMTMRREYRLNLSDEEAHRQFDSYPVAQYVLARFADSKLVYLSASVSGSASVPQNLRVPGF
jgi:hypothetical protein